MRINKFISHNTGYSRRVADEFIKNSQVLINNKIASLTDTVKETDKVSLKGKRLFKKKSFSVIVYHKPKAELVSHKDDRSRRTIFQSLPSEFKNYKSVGRLDYASSGLLLLSDSACISSALMHSDLEREYYLKVKGYVSKEVIYAFENGLSINSKKGAHEKSKITQLSFAPFLEYEIFGQSAGYTKLRVVINEGKNRELRRFFAHFDLEVLDLKRVAFGAIELGMLKQARFRYLTRTEYDKLRDFLKLNKIYY